MKKTLKENCKKFLIMTIVIILVTSLMPINTVVAVTNTVKEELEQQENSVENQKENTNKTEENLVQKTEKPTEITDDKENNTQNTTEKNEIVEEQNKKEDKKEDTKQEINNNVETKTESKVQVTPEAKTMQTRAVQKSSDLTNFVKEVKILNLDGTEVEGSLQPDQTYEIQLHFEESDNLQFEVNAEGKMIYQLPNAVKVLSAIPEQDIVSSLGVPLGKYAIDANGLVSVTWNNVDRHGNPIDQSYIEYYNDAFLNLQFSSKIMATSVGEEIQIDFGNDIKIDVTFDHLHSIIVNKKAGNYNSQTHSIDYEVELVTYAQMNNVKMEDVLDSRFDLNLEQPINITYNYSNGQTRTVNIDIQNYPNSVTVNDNGTTKVLYGEQVKEYIEILDGKFVLYYKDLNASTVESQTQIIAKYSTKIKDNIITGTTQGAISFDATNIATGTGNLNNGIEVSSTDTETVPVNHVLLEKSGWYVAKGDPTLNNKEDVIVWHIALGDGYSKINGTSITDVLGQKLTFATNELCLINLYDKNKQVIKQELCFLKDSSIKINGNTFTYTVPTDQEYYGCEIYYCTYYEKGVTVGTEGFNNYASVVGPIGNHQTGGTAWVGTNLMNVNKSVDPIRTGDDSINYKVEIDIPGAYYKQWFYIYDITQVATQVWDGQNYVEKSYFVNYQDFEEYFLENLKITATDNQGHTVEFVNYATNPTAPHTYTILYGGISNYGQVMIGFNGADENTIHWNIAVDSKLTIEYKVPLNTDVYDRAEGSKGKLEEYTGKTIKNIVEATGRNEAGTTYLGKDDVDAQIPQILDKTYEFIQNTNLAKFKIVLNQNKADLDPDSDTLTVLDTMSPELEFLPTTLEVNAYNEQTQQYDIPIAVELEETTDPATNETTVKIKNIPDATNVEIRYNALMKGSGLIDVSNLAQIMGVIGTSSKTEYQFEVQNSSAVSGGSETGVTFSIEKYGETDTGKELLANVAFELSKVESNGTETVIGSPTTDKDGKIILQNMDKGTYYLKELSTVDTSYILLQDKITIVIADNNTITATYPKDGIINVVEDSNNTTIEVLNKKQLNIELEGTKTWVDFDNKDKTRPEEITVNLLANGTEVQEVKVTEATNWTYEFTNLPKYDKAGDEIDYTITEDEVKGYETEVEGTNITNTLITTEVEGTKTWVDFDNKDKTRPEEITVNLLANGTEVQEVKVTEATNWTYEFTNLPKYDKAGNEIAYTITEDEVKGYNTEVVGTNIINNLLTTELEGTKTWVDFDNKDKTRPEEITVNLLANGKLAGWQKVTEATNWTYEFTNLPKYDKAGDEIDYTITEDEVKGYETEVEGTNITNTLITTELEGTKTWVDFDNKDKTRPEEITVNLLANGTEVQEVKVTEATNWTYEFTNLPKYDKAGNEIDYTITEDEVKGYETEVEGTNITNTLITTEVEGTKTWVDFDNKDKTRPEEITVNLLANGTEVQEVKVTEATNWTYEFTNLPKYDKAGNEIAYTITEDEVKGYNTEVVGTNIINNLLTTELEGTKTWVDFDNKDKTRPEEITVNLLANGKLAGWQKVTETTNWEYEFTNLPKYDKAGNEITYTITEDEVKGYETEVVGTNITNTLITTELEGTKTWVDFDNKNKTRPEEITVNLLANGTEVQEVKVTEATNWTYEFTNLPKYDKAGNEIAYTITEDEVKGYETEVEGTNITNTLITTELEGTKTWVDFDNKDKTRPEEITVNLLANGTEVQEVKVTEATNWTYEFTNLPKYDKAGNEIAYTITEEEVKGYETEVVGTNITNTLITTELEGTKTWVDFDNKDKTRPEEITVNLLANGTEVQEVKVTEATNWTYEFTNLPKYDKAGNEIAYTITEDEVKGYNTEVVGTNIINNLITTELEGTKTWVDFDNKDKTRPEEITVNLLANGKLAGWQKVTEATNWEYEFTNLPKYDKAGNEITYTITEDEVKGYETEVVGTNITNTLITTELEGTKTWVDFDNKNKTRPEEITVNLLANGTEVQEVKVTEATNWTYEFTNLPKYDKAGNEIAYTITEEEVKGYETEVVGTNITNTLITTELEGTKTWVDFDNKDKTRPEEITVNLLANGTEVQEVKVTEATNWTYEFTNLPKYDKAGNEIAYTITEDEVKGYNTEVVGTNITNTLITTEVEGEKIWEDFADKWNLRPDTITINLLVNGEEVEDIVISEEDNWEYKFANLPKYDKNGNEIKYTVSEDKVKGYITIIDGNIITNKVIEPEKVLGVTKTRSMPEPVQEVVFVNELDNTPKTGTNNKTADFIKIAILSAGGILAIRRIRKQSK